MKPLKELRAEEHAGVEVYEITPGVEGLKSKNINALLFNPRQKIDSYKAGWEGCLEELSKSAGEDFDKESIKIFLSHQGNPEWGRYYIAGAEFEFDKLSKIISAQRLRIEELEGERK